jgi:hypothetical protein
MKKVFTEKNREWSISFEEGRPKPFRLKFFKKYCDKADPEDINKDLKGIQGFKTERLAKIHAKKVCDRITDLGKMANATDVNRQTQIIVLTQEIERYGINVIRLLEEARDLAKNEINPIDALVRGGSTASIAEKFPNATLGDFILRYDADSENKKNGTHKLAVKDLNALGSLGLKVIPLLKLASIDSAMEAIQPVLQQYCNRPTVKRFSSLKTQKARLRQLFKFISKVTKGEIPSKYHLDYITDIGNYELSHSLKAEKEDYAFRADEFLILVKFLSQPDTFNPTYPIVCGLMGARAEMYDNLKWSHFDFTTGQINIPKALTKLSKQGTRNKGINFMMEVIPHLRKWLKWSETLLVANKKKGIFLKTIDKGKTGIYKNKCLAVWKDYFLCRPEEGDDYLWENIAHNGFRNMFMSLGLRHPKIKDHVSIISNDYTSHQKYFDYNMADYEKQSNALFNLTPSCLDLVDLDKRTVDKEFIYTDDKDKELMWELEEDPDKKAVYEKILIDLGILCPF